MQHTMSYSVGGRVFDLPSDKVQGFLETAKANGDAPEEAYSYRVSGKDGASREFTIPRSKYEGFRQTAEANGDTVEPLRTMTMADGTRRSFTMKEMSDYLRSDEYRNSRDAKETRDAIESRLPAPTVEGDERTFGDELNASGGGAIGRMLGSTVAGLFHAGGQMLRNAAVASPLGMPGMNLSGVDSKRALESVKDNAADKAGNWVSEWTNALFPEVDANGVVQKATSKTAELGAGLAKFGIMASNPYSLAALVAESAGNSPYETYDAAIRGGMSPEEANGLAMARGFVDGGITAAFAAAPVKRLAGALGLKTPEIALPAVKDVIKGGASTAKNQLSAGIAKAMAVEAAKSAAEMGGLTYAQGLFDNAAMQEATNPDKPIDWEKAAKDAGWEALEQAGMGAALGLLPTPVRIAKARKALNASIADAVRAPNGAETFMGVNPEGATSLAEAYRKNGTVSRKDAQRAGLPEMNEADRNGIAKRIIDVQEKWDTSKEVAAKERVAAEAEMAKRENAVKSVEGQREKAQRKAEMDEYERQDQERIAREKAEEAAAPEVGEEQARLEAEQKASREANTPIDGEEQWGDYKEWLKKKGRADNAKNWNKFVAENELDPALKRDTKDAEAYNAWRESVEKRRAGVEEPKREPYDGGAQAEYEAKMAAYEEARAKREAEKKRFGRTKTELPEKPTPPELRVEKPQKPVIEADLSDISKKTAQVGKETPEKTIPAQGKPLSAEELNNRIDSQAESFDKLNSELKKKGASKAEQDKARSEFYDNNPEFAHVQAIRFERHIKDYRQTIADLEGKESLTDNQKKMLENAKARLKALEDHVRKYNPKSPVLEQSEPEKVPDGRGRMVEKPQTEQPSQPLENAPSRAPQGNGTTSQADGAKPVEARNGAPEKQVKPIVAKTSAAKKALGKGKSGYSIEGTKESFDDSVDSVRGEIESLKDDGKSVDFITKDGKYHISVEKGRVLNHETDKYVPAWHVNYTDNREGISGGGVAEKSIEDAISYVKKLGAKVLDAKVPDGKGRMVRKSESPAPTAKVEGGQKRTAATSDELKPLKDAISEAKKIAVEKPRFGTSTPTKTFEAKVGTTTIKFGNTAEGIAAAEKMAKKLSVVKDWMPKNPQGKPPSAPKPLKVAKGKDVGTFDDVASDFFAGKNEFRKVLKAPFVKDGYIYATDGHTLIRMKTDAKAKDTEGAPDAKRVFSDNVGNAVEKFKIDASAESVPLEQARAATDKYFTGVEIWRSPDGKIVMRSRTAEDTSESNSAFMNASSLKGHDYIGTFDPDYIEKAFRAFAKLGVKDVDVEWSGATKPLYIHGGGAEVLVMPLRIGDNGALSADTKVQLLGGRRRMTDAQRAEAVNQQIADEIALAKEKDPKITQKQIGEIEERIRDAEAKVQGEIGKHKGNLDPMLSPDKPLGETISDTAAELDRLIAEEESAAQSGSSADGLPSRSYSWKSGSGVGGLFPRLVSKNSIVRKMKELFPEFAIRGENTTKIGASYAGHFEPWRELIRSKDMASIDTIPHEIGHGISMRTKRKAMNIPQEAKRELAKFGRQLYGNKKPNGGYMEEGFAEYVRGYMTGAENLAAEAPALDRWFNNTFAKANPEYVEKMRQIRLEVQRYRQQSDIQKVAAFMKPDSGRVSRAVEAVKSFFSAENWNDTNATLTRGIKDSGMSRMFEWRQEFRDLEKAIKEGRTADAAALRKSIDEKIASDPRIFASNSRGTSKSRVMDAFENGVTDIEGFGKIGNVVGWKADGTPIRDNNTESVRDIFKSFSRKELADWDKYAIAKVGLENYINEGREFGLERSVCENIVRDLESPKFEDALKRFTDFTRRGVSVGLESGALSRSDYEAMTGAHKYYVRIERRLAPDGTGLGGAQQNPFHKIKGSSKNILNPRAATMIQMERQIRFFQAAKLLNLIGKATLRAEKANADFAKGVGNEEYQVAANMPLRVANAQEAVNFTSEKLKEDFKKRASQAFEDNGQAQPGVMTTRRGKLMTEAQSMALDLYDSMYGEDGTKLTIFREKPSNGKNGLVSTYIDGKLVTFELPDARWTKFVTGMENDALFNSKGAQTAWKIATAPSRTLKLGATLINTAFTTANVTRDTQHAAVTSESRQIPVVNIAQGLYDILYSKKTSALFKQMGGEAALFAGSSKERQYENAARMASANTLFKKVGASLYNPVHATTGAISSILSVPEMAPRVREMAGVMKKAQDAGLSYETAARLGFAAAKEVSLDFGKHGQYMRYLNDVMPYTNAWYRGLEQLSRKFGITEELPTSFEERRGVKARNTVGKGLLFATLPAIATTIAKMAMSDEDEREATFKKTPREKWDFDDSLGVRLAQPFELGAIFHALPKAMVYEAYGDKGAVKEALWHGIESNVLRFKDPADFARGMSLISPWLDIAMNEKWDDSPIVSPFIKENMPKSEWKDYSTTAIASWLGEKMDWAPAYIDHVANSYTGGMWKRWLSPAADNSLMTLTGLSTFRPRPTARRDVGDFYGFAEETRRKYNGGKASPDEVGRLRRAEKLKDDLSGDFKEARNLNNAGLSTDERNKRREEIMFRVFRKIRDWDKAEVSNRDIGIRKAVDAISAKEITNAEKSTLDKNFSVIKGISIGELEYQLREYGHEYVPDGKGKMRPRWTKDTIKKRVRNLYNAIQLMD